MLKNFLYASAALCLLAVGGSALWIARSVARARADLDATQQALVLTVEEARSDLAVTQGALVNLSSFLSKKLVQIADKRAGEFTAEVSALRKSIAALPVAPVLTEAANAERQLSSSLEAFRTATVDITAMLPPIRQQIELLGDCKQNPRLCLAPRLAGTLRAIELSAGNTQKVTKEAARVAPETLNNVRDTSKNVKTLTSWPVQLGKALLSLPGRFIRLF